MVVEELQTEELSWRQIIDFEHIIVIPHDIVEIYVLPNLESSITYFGLLYRRNGR